MNEPHFCMLTYNIERMNPPIGFSSFPEQFSVLPKHTHACIAGEIPPLMDIFPYEISASLVSHIPLDLYTNIQTIPYGILSGIYYSARLRQWVILEFNRFRKIAAAWILLVSGAGPVPGPNNKDAGFYMGIHVLDQVPRFVETHRLRTRSELRGWPYEIAQPYTTDIRPVQDSILDMTLASPYKIHHLRFMRLGAAPRGGDDVNILYPNTTIRIQDILEEPVINVLDAAAASADVEVEDGRVEPFCIRAGNDWDIFHMYARDASGSLLFYDTLYIANLEQSQIWNARFRGVQLADNYDWIENAATTQKRLNHCPGRKCTIDNYSRLNKEKGHTVWCRYEAKFKKWVPVEMATGNRKPVQLPLVKH